MGNISVFLTILAALRRTVSFLATSAFNELDSTGDHRCPGEKQHFPVNDATLIYTKRAFGPSFENENV